MSKGPTRPGSTRTDDEPSTREVKRLEQRYEAERVGKSRSTDYTVKNVVWGGGGGGGGVGGGGGGGGGGGRRRRSKGHPAGRGRVGAGLRA